MRRAYILAITTVTILVVMLLQMQNFAARQNSELNTVSQMLVSEKVAHTWSDVRDDIRAATNILIEKINRSAIFHDSLPSILDVADFLHLYGVFVSNYYKSGDIEINFLSPGGSTMDLGTLPPEITILPFNIEYTYPSWSKEELIIKAPAENVSAITNITIHLNFTNAYMDCTPARPGATQNCDFINPSQLCDGNTDYRLYLNMSFSDYLGQYYQMPNRCFDLSKHSTENLNVRNATGSFFLKVDIGALPFVIDIKMQNTKVNATTEIILNTTDFYISYLSQLQVNAVNYNTTRIERT